MPAEYFIGLMSGTSLDGVDAALVSFRSRKPRCVATHYLPYADDMRRDALALHVPGCDELQRAAELSNRLADVYAQAVGELLAKSGTAADDVRAIGCHGQTVRHAPAAGYTLQLNNPARLAEKTGIAVIADFRSRDIAAGGQGAPLVPAFHDALFRASDRHRVIVNIGGIANLTDLAPGRRTGGFDCGPGNMLLDAWAARHLGTAYDDGGRWARSGRVLPGLLTRLGGHPFFAATPPKSCGREEFGSAWLDSQLDGSEAAADVQATLVALTVAGIAQAVERWCGKPAEVFVCGGGAHNAVIMEQLAAQLPFAAVGTTAALGLPADWVEAVAFAWLAYRTLRGLPGNLPEVTGASGPRILGAIYPA
ncbi:MAG: anhydro-N-acetylmuramic acid kinase [Rhodocyclaceae bacterium]|nr:anhydro-N-acetylmuramic acid kinase [Rhodocyclaceae bacterium]